MAISNLSSGLRPGVCTSTTRPTTPYEGQVIYETDTDKVLVWNGSSWYPNWNTAWGLVAYTKRVSSSSTITTEAVTITGGSFTAIANRYYKITYFEPDIFSGTGNEGQMRIRLTNISGTIQQAAYYEINSANLNMSNLCVGIVTLSAGTTNFVATMNSINAGVVAQASSTRFAFLSVEDIGPA